MILNLILVILFRIHWFLVYFFVTKQKAKSVMSLQTLLRIEIFDCLSRLDSFKDQLLNCYQNYMAEQDLF